jgi:hypothetical protein
MNGDSPLAYFRPNFDVPWRGAPPVDESPKNRRIRPKSPLNDRLKMEPLKGAPWSPTSVNPNRTNSPPPIKHVTFLGLPPRPKSAYDGDGKGRRRSPSSSIRRRRRSQSPPTKKTTRSSHRSKSSSCDSSSSSVRRKRTTRIHQNRLQRRTLTNKTVAPFWLKSTSTGMDRASLKTLHPDEFKPKIFPSNSLENVLESTSKRRNKILSHEMLDHAMRGEVSQMWSCSFFLIF